jgi:DNA-directed RNA polymerase subunit beta
MLNTLFKKKIIKDTSFKSPKSYGGTITKVRLSKKRDIFSVTIFMAERRKIKLGDKLAGRHGNKGIISKILNRENMPYTQDGLPLDIILNPLGIPSRMNVGQIFECLLTLAATNLKEKYLVAPFDERQTGYETSRRITYRKLKEAKKKTKKDWLLNPNYPGKTKLFDGRTGTIFNQPILVGYAYILKLTHMVDDKINSRLTGPYTMVLKQPVRGKAKNGGQRLGEMEVWAIEGYGAAYTLQEMLTIKSDDLYTRSKAMYNIIKDKNIPTPNIPESLKTLILEIQSLCLEINIYTEKKLNFFNT